MCYHQSFETQESPSLVKAKETITMATKESHYKTIKNRYIVAFVLIALLSTAAFFTLKLALHSSDTTALVVNMSGKQRMLSQRIALYSQLYYRNVYLEGKVENKEPIAAVIGELSKEMNQSNEALSSGRLNEEFNVELSPTIHEYFFAEPNVKNRVEEYLALASSLTKTSNPAEARLYLETMLSQVEPLLRDLDGIVLQYQKEGDANIQVIDRYETIAWTLTLLTLVLEAIFIFQPMAQRIDELVRKLLWNQKNLEQEIRLRTLSLENANMKLLHLASHDPLTGLKNRLNMEKDLEAILLHHEIHQVPFGVVMIDIDWFKKVNDRYGHDMGDFVLTELARMLSDSVRSQDSVYRTGGEEFVIVFNRITHPQLVEKMEKIRQAIKAHRFMYDGHELSITISGGMYHSDRGMNGTVVKILKLADKALYHSKNRGRDCISDVSRENGEAMTGNV